MLTTLTAKTYYEVLWGIDDHGRQTWIDYGDGTAASQDALANAGRLLLEFAKNGGKAGLFVNGVHKAGHDFAEEWAAWEEEAAKLNAEWDEYEEECGAPVEHKTRTLLFAGASEPRLNWSNMKMVYDRSAMARCTCGWFEAWDNRDAARRAAREHRAEAASARVRTA